MPIDIALFRAEKGGNPDVVRESQIKRGKDPKIVDEIIQLDELWRKILFQQNTLNKDLNNLSKSFAKGKGKESAPEVDPAHAKAESKRLKTELEETETKLEEVAAQRSRLLNMIGNLVHESVPVSLDEKDNRIEGTWGECKRSGTEKHHHELLHMIDGYSPKPGTVVAGHRGYFLKGVGVLLNQALINYGLNFLAERKYIALQPPYFMRKEVMAETAQLEQFDEELYKVTGDGEEKYLIATSEQPISAYHRHETIEADQVPLKYAGISTCFRKEAGSHGRDTWGIFRIHQFEKVEQFVVCAPDKSWEMHEEMLKTAEEFYQSLGIPYRIVNIVSGELNNAAAKKYDVEAWFPALGEYRELVSCSNCTDYQARAMETRYGYTKTKENEKTYTHMLNATLCATERTICCLLENYQTAEGVMVPQVLRPYMQGLEIMKFVQAPPENINAQKQEKAAQKKQKNK